MKMQILVGKEANKTTLTSYIRITHQLGQTQARFSQKGYKS